MKDSGFDGVKLNKNAISIPCHIIGGRKHKHLTQTPNTHLSQQSPRVHVADVLCRQRHPNANQTL